MDKKDVDRRWDEELQALLSPGVEDNIQRQPETTSLWRDIGTAGRARHALQR